MTKYMHTIDGRPACFHQGLIVFTATGSAVHLVASLSVIRRQQRQTKEFRLRNNFDYEPDRYGYIRVRV